MSQIGRKWVVGLDLRPASQGAIVFANWLVEHSRCDPPERLIGIHVLEGDHLRAALRYHHMSELVTAAHGAVARVLAATGNDRFEASHIIEGGLAEQSLEAARGYHNAHGMILGRVAGSKRGVHVLRLGRVARRVLRQLSSPAVIVPPDFDPSEHTGPVIVTSNLRSDCGAAALWAASMAERLGRGLIVAHVVPLPNDYGAHYIPQESLEKLRAEHQETGEAMLQTWAKDHGLEGADLRVLQGAVVESVVGLAAEERACLLVTGSRRLSVFERFLLTSIGSELAAAASTAVAVVPPKGLETSRL